MNSWNPLGIDDPIAESLPLMLDAARRLCPKPDSQDGTCFTYHRVWPYLRSLRLKKAAWGRSRHYVSSFRALARQGFKKIMISGCADYSLLAHVLFAYRAEEVEPIITVLDLCETPLFINQWYAKRHQTSISTIARSITDYQNDSFFDVITTDNFMHQFRPGERARILDRWRELLCSGGRIVTAQSVQIDEEHREPRDAKERSARILRTAEAQREILDIAPTELADLATRYDNTRVRHPRASTAELTSLFEAHGFTVDEVSRMSAEECQDLGIDDHRTKRSRRISITVTKR